MKKRRIVCLVIAAMFCLSTVSFAITPIAANASMQANTENRYLVRGGSPVGIVSERIDYTTRKVTTDVLFPQTPSYVSGYSCGVTGGGTVVAWYNSQVGGLIPGLASPGIKYGSTWFWAGQNSAINDMFDNLEDYMGNNGSNGVTTLEYVAGLGYYMYTVGGKTMSVSTVRAGNNSLTSDFYSAMKNGKPVTLFLNGFNLMDFSALGNYTNYDTIYLTEYEGLHVMVAYGYLTLSYYDSSSNTIPFREDTYLYVASCGFIGNAWLRINSNCTLDAAYTTHVS